MGFQVSPSDMSNCFVTNAASVAAPPVKGSYNHTGTHRQI